MFVEHLIPILEFLSIFKLVQFCKELLIDGFLLIDVRVLELHFLVF